MFQPLTRRPRAPHVFVPLLVVALTFAACSKKSEPAKAGAKAGATGAAGKAKAAAKGAAEAVKGAAGTAKQAAAAAVRKVTPAPKDVSLATEAGVVAWLTIKSLSSAFDAVETIAGKMGAVPPNASLREAAYRDLTKILSQNGVTGHEWLDKSKPLHVAFQDDDKQKPQSGLVILLPVTDNKKALAAFVTAKKGADAKGHAALLVVGPNTAFVDFVPGYLVLTSAETRFKKVEGFCKRLAKLTPPALAYVGVSVKEVAKTRKAELDMLLTQLDKMNKRNAGMAASSDYYNKMLKEWLTDLERFEVVLNATGDNVEVGWRLHAKPGTRIARQMLAGKGRDASRLAGTLPGNSYVAFVGDMDPSAAVEQLEDSVRVLKEAFKLDDATMKTLADDVRSTAKLQDGTSFMAAYPDGDAPLGLVAGSGATDPKAMIDVLRNVVSAILLRTLEMQEEKAAKRDPKAPTDPKMAIVKRALKERKVTPLIEAFGPVAKEAGLTVTANTTTAKGVRCEVVDLTMDWAKLKKAGGKDAERAAAVLGPRTALALCAGAKRAVFAAGPSALEQGRRAAAGKAGGLADAPVFKGALKRSVAAPAWYMYVNAGAALKAFEKAMPAPVPMPADRAISVGCGNRERSFACEIDVPVEIIKVVVALSRQR